MLTQEIRRQFLKYFRDQGHALIPSSPVLPHDDPTLLFTNAGMNQFKDVFLGSSVRDYTRAATSQKCIRVGGKHNDLENVGHTRRHLTFFEMLGNFSFGDYFKEQAIQFAWEVTTSVFQFDPEKIYPSVFREDDEAFELWKKYVPEARISRMDEKDNFWEMGESGPCGPSSELYFDRGALYGDATRPEYDVKGDRFFEFWNLVFMQFNRESKDKVVVLPKPSIDTGAGLERIISLKMGVDSIFETDVLRSLIAKVENVSNVSYDLENPKTAPAFRVIADHLRCLSFAIADGAQPSNLDRGYVLRKVLRRAVRYGRQLGIEDPFLAKVLPRLVEEMGEDYPELAKAQNRIAEILTGEEEAFLRTLKRGGNMLTQVIEQAKKQSNQISGDDAFKLKDTYGLPLDEITLLAKDADLTVDTIRYQVLEGQAKERSRNAQKGVQQVASQSLFETWAKEHGSSLFLGYSTCKSSAKIVGILVNGVFCDTMQAGDEGMVLLNQTPFYAEMGGQVGDTGILTKGQTIFTVSGCKAPFKGVIAHIGKLEGGEIQVGDAVNAAVDERRREQIANNHTATHLLHWALQKILGEHIKQAGSVVDEQRLRFDFNHHKALTVEEIRAIEELVNSKIRENRTVESYEISFEDAVKRSEIKQFFGDKYGSSVRVIDIDFSKELCGGTHTSKLGNIGFFRIAKENSIAAGVRRIEAVTGADALKISHALEDDFQELANLVKTQPQKLKERIEQLLEENKLMSLELKELKKNRLKTLSMDLVKKVEQIRGIPLLAVEVEASADELKVLADQTMEQLQSGVLLLGARIDGRGSLLLRVSEDLTKRGLDANRFIKEIAPLIDGSGGGRSTQATAGGKDPEKIPLAIQKLRDLIP